MDPPPGRLHGAIPRPWAQVANEHALEPPEWIAHVAEVEEGRGHGGLGTWLLRGAQQPNEDLLHGHWLRCGHGEIGGQCASGAHIAPILSLLHSEPRKRA